MDLVKGSRSKIPILQGELWLKTRKLLAAGRIGSTLFDYSIPQNYEQILYIELFSAPNSIFLFFVQIYHGKSPFSCISYRISRSTGASVIVTYAHGASVCHHSVTKMHTSRAICICGIFNTVRKTLDTLIEGDII